MNPRFRTILALALPIIGGMTSQNILNLVDTAMVGQLGSVPLAAAGAGSFAVFMSVAFIQGLGAGVQAISARRLGEGRDAVAAMSLNGGLLLSLLAGIPLALLLFWLAPVFLPLIKDDAELLGQMIPYYRIRVLAMASIGCNFAFRGFWNGTNRSKLYLNTLLVVHGSNLLLNWVLIFGKLGFPAMGLEGAALASAVATCLGTATYVFLGLRHARSQGFLDRIPSMEELLQLSRLSIPAGIQQSFLAAGFVALFWIVGRIGATEMAAANVIMNVNLVGILPALGLGIAAGSLAGQAIGRGDPEDAERWGWDVVKTGLGAVTVVSIPVVLFPGEIISFFVSDPATIEAGLLPMRIAGCILLTEPFLMILLYALMGVGANRTTMKASILVQWGIGLPLSYLLGPKLGFGLAGVWIGQGIYRIALSCVFAVIWKRRRWAEIKL